MMQELACENYNDKDGNPEGGSVKGTGIWIEWQKGPLGRGEERISPNGAFVEGVIQAAKQRIEYYQAGYFRCEENQTAIIALGQALEALDRRTGRREAQNVEGTHEGN